MNYLCHSSAYAMQHKERKMPLVPRQPSWLLQRYHDCRHSAAHTATRPRLPAPISSALPAACLAQLTRPSDRMLAIILRARLLGTSAAELLAALEAHGLLQA
jgi:hypothetical protein